MDSKRPPPVIYTKLPQEFLPESSNNQNVREGYDFLKNILLRDLPRADIGGIDQELRKRFYLDKHVAKKKKPVRRKKTFLTRQERKQLNLLKIPKDGWNYKSLDSIRDMWKDYMRQNFDLIDRAPYLVDPEWTSFSTVVSRSELVGAEITVVRSKVCNQVGMSGTIVLETKMTFQIVTPQNRLKILMKENSVFEFRLDNLKFTVFGKHLTTRPSERSVRKIKSQMSPDL